jgi:hypothetical protein
MCRRVLYSNEEFVFLPNVNTVKRERNLNTSPTSWRPAMRVRITKWVRVKGSSYKQARTAVIPDTKEDGLDMDLEFRREDISISMRLKTLRGTGTEHIKGSTDLPWAEFFKHIETTALIKYFSEEMDRRIQQGEDT